MGVNEPLGEVGCRHVVCSFPFVSKGSRSFVDDLALSTSIFELSEISTLTSLPSSLLYWAKCLYIGPSGDYLVVWSKVRNYNNADIAAS